MEKDKTTFIQAIRRPDGQLDAGQGNLHTHVVTSNAQLPTQQISANSQQPTSPRENKK